MKAINWMWIFKQRKLTPGWDINRRKRGPGKSPVPAFPRRRPATPDPGVSLSKCFYMLPLHYIGNKQWVPVSGVHTEMYSDKGQSESAGWEKKPGEYAVLQSGFLIWGCGSPSTGQATAAVDETLGLEREAEDGEVACISFQCFLFSATALLPSVSSHPWSDHWKLTIILSSNYYSIVL